MSSYDAFMSNGVFCQGGLLTSWGLQSVGDNFFVTWCAFTILALLTVFSTSGPLFYFYYARSQVTFEKCSARATPSFPPQKR